MLGSLLGIAAASLGLFVSEGLAQQGEGIPELEGRVVLGSDSAGLGGVQVQLHRITPDSGGVVATRVSGVDGSFRFPLAPPDSLAVFLASVRYGGVLYYGAPLHGGHLPESPYTIAAYDTALASAPRRFPVSLRHVVLAPAGEGVEVIDVFELENVDDRTWVSSVPGEPVWSARLPAGAREGEALPSGLAAGEVEFREGRVRLNGTLAPGKRSVAVRYWLPARATYWPIDDTTGEMEFLTPVEGGLRTKVDGLREEETRDLRGQPYRRLSANDLGPGSRLKVRWQREGEGSPVPWLWLVLGVLLLAAAWVSWRRAGDRLAPGE